jgi:hypothetical protein
MLDYQNADALRSLDAQQRLDWQRGYQVIDPGGGSNTPTVGSGNYEVDVASGDINFGGSTVSCTAQTADLSTAVAADPQIAVVYRDAAGDVQFETGPAQARDPDGEAVRATFEPAAPTLYDINGVAIAEVLLDQSVGDVTASELRDRRVPGELAVGDFTAIGTTTLSALDGEVVDTANLSDDAVTAAKIAAAAVQSEQIDTDAVTVDELASGLGTGSGSPIPGTSFFETVDVDSATIDGDPAGGFGDTSSLSLSLGGGFTVIDPNRPAFITLVTSTETDGSTQAVIDVEVDESGGSSPDYEYQVGTANETEGSGVKVIQASTIYVPPGASVNLKNQSDPNGGNVVFDTRKAVL